MIEPMLQSSGVDAVSGFLEATVRYATPLALAALGECVSERAGVINIGLEGAIICGALGGTIVAGIAGPAVGFAAGALAGIAIAALFALFAVWLRADQIITGTAITLLSLGLTGTIYRSVYGAGGVALSTPTVGAMAVPGLSSIPLIGRAIFAQPLITYALYGLTPLIACPTKVGHVRQKNCSPRQKRAHRSAGSLLRKIPVVPTGICGNSDCNDQQQNSSHKQSLKRGCSILDAAYWIKRKFDRAA